MVDFNSYNLLIGSISGFILSVSKVLLNYCIKFGPCGLICALILASSTLTYIALETLKKRWEIGLVGIIGIVLCVFGCVILGVS